MSYREMTDYEAGYHAGYDGAEQSACPYPAHDDGRRWEWLRGWAKGGSDCDVGKDPEF